MAKDHSIEIAGRTFGPDAVFPPSLLADMFGPSLPSAIQTGPDGSAPASSVARYLQRQGEAGLRAMLAGSVIVTPGTAEALAELSRVSAA